MTYADMFSKVKGLFMESDVSDISEHLAFQFNITGEAEGIFYAEVKDGVLAVEPYEYFDRDAIFICCSRGRRQCLFLQEDHDALQCQEGAHDEDVRG